MPRYVFVGPTLKPTEARKITHAIVLPPLQVGQIQQLTLSADAIAIIDGAVDATAFAKIADDIRWVLARNIPVMGGAGAGAVWAHMLASSGMTGVGKNYKSLSSSNVGVDELVCRHGGLDTDFVHLSESLVDIYSSLRSAYENGLLSREEEASLSRIARSLHPLDRTYARLFGGEPGSGFAPEMAAKARSFCQSLDRGSSCDARSVIAELNTLQSVEKDSISAEPVSAADACVSQSTTNSPMSAVQKSVTRERLTECGESMAVIRKKVLLRILACREAQRAGIDATPEMVQEMSEEFRSAFDLDTGEKLEDWLRQNGLNVEIYARSMRDFAFVKAVESAHASEIEEMTDYHVAVSMARGWHTARS